MPGRTFLYAAIGATLRRYAVDAGRPALSLEATTTTPQAVQYACRHPTRPILYVAYSNRATGADDHHGIAPYGIAPDGTLTPLAPPTPLPSRPIHLAAHPDGNHLLTAYNAPSALTVHRLLPGGHMGPEIEQPQLDCGTFAHQILPDTAGTSILLCTRGNDPTATRPADPGALKLFRFQGGQLTPAASIGQTPAFGPRHAVFHPTLPRLYVSMERSNQLFTYATPLSQTPLCILPTALNPAGRLPFQYLGPIHLHPDGRTLYLVNRSDGLDGENTIAAFTLDHAGNPTPLQTIGTGTIHCRTFSIHPDGTLLVTAAIAPLTLPDGTTIPAGLTLFTIAPGGRLTLARTELVDVGNQLMFWSGMLTL